ncbi:MAG: type IV pilus modification protein PilV [Pseudomonadota bacterium]
MRRQKGLTLLEVLISVLLLSIGILGVAGLQLHALRSSTEADLRSQARLQVRDMIERVRMMPEQREAFRVKESNCAEGSTPGGSSFVANELNNWCRAVARGLPGGQGEIDVSGNDIRVRVSWLERAAPDSQDFSQDERERTEYSLSAIIRENE